MAGTQSGCSGFRLSKQGKAAYSPPLSLYPAVAGTGGQAVMPGYATPL